jgi:hypothetical protein
MTGSCSRMQYPPLKLPFPWIIFISNCSAKISNSSYIRAGFINNPLYSWILTFLRWFSLFPIRTGA